MSSSFDQNLVIDEDAFENAAKRLERLSKDIEALKERLLNRGTDSIDVINERLAIAEKEIRENTFYDYKIINDNLENAVKSLENIIKNNID